MAASRISHETVSASASQTSSGSITVPSDCTLVIVQWHYWDNSSSPTMSSLSIDGDNFTIPVNVARNGGLPGYGGAWLKNPSTGSQSISWSWSTGSGIPLNNGAELIITYVKGEATTPIRDYDGARNNYANAVSVTIDSETDDLILASCQHYFDRSGSPGLDGTAYIDNVIYNSEETDASEVTASATSTTVEMTNEWWSTMVAVAIESSSSTSVSVGLSQETNSAQGLGVILGIGQASETESALSIAPSTEVIGVIGQASTTDTAFSIAPITNVSGEIGLTSETDSALSVTPQTDVSAVIGQSEETDTALSISPVAGVSGSIGTAEETNTAQSIGVQLGIGYSEEIDTAQGVGVSLEIGLAEATDQAFAITPQLTLGIAQDTESAQSISVSLGIGIAQESESAFEITPVSGDFIAIGTASETDTATSIGIALGIGQAQETDFAYPVMLPGVEEVVEENPGIGGGVFDFEDMSSIIEGRVREIEARGPVPDFEESPEVFEDTEEAPQVEFDTSIKERIETLENLRDNLVSLQSLEVKQTISDPIDLAIPIDLPIEDTFKLRKARALALLLVDGL